MMIAPTRRLSLASIGNPLAAAAVLAFVAAAVAYLFYPGYIDHGEAATSGAAWLMLKGGQVYLPLDSPDQITSLYGPFTYLWHAWPLALFGGGIASSKLGATIAAVLIPVGLWAIVRRDAMAGWIIAFAAGMLIIHLAFPVVIRPDSLLTLLTAAATLAAVRDGGERWRTVLIGLAAGAAVATKIHGAVYLAPVAIYHVLGDWRRAPVLAASAVAAALLPFALPPFSLATFLSWFGPFMAKENSWGDALGKMGEVLALYAVPLVIWALAGRKGWAAAGLPACVYAGSYGIAVVLILFPATKNGGGPHYLMPLLPAAIDLIRRGLAAGGAPLRQRLTVAAFALVALGTAWQCERRFFKKLEWDKARAVVAEIEQILDAHPGEPMQMGTGRTPEDIGAQFSFHYYNWHNLPVFRGNPYTIDAGIVMELRKLNQPFPPEAIARLEHCQTRLWLIPKGGEPFDLAGYYNQQVFPPEVRQAFLAHHVKAESHAFFDVWRCRP